MKRVLGVAFLFLLLVQLVCAVEVDMKSDFNRYETLTAKVSGNFVKPLLGSNFFLYREHVRVPLEFHVKYIEGYYYAYAQLSDKEPGNYTLSLENIEYMSRNEILKDKIKKNLSITGNIAEFSVEPGFIVTDTDFSIRVQNMKGNDITIQVMTGTSGIDSANKSEEEKGFLESLFGGGTDSESSSGSVLLKSVVLKSDEIKDLEFSTREFNSSFSMISLSTENLTYEIPVSLPVLEGPEKEKSFRFEKSEIAVSMATNSNAIRRVYLHNTGEEVLENISMFLPDSLLRFVSLSPMKIEELNPNSSVQVEIFMNSSAESRNYSGQITAKTSENLSAYLALSLNFIRGFVPSGEEDREVFQTCSEMQGRKCSGDGETCVGNFKDSLDGLCCIGNCIKEEKSSLGRIIGIILFIAIAGFLVWFYLKKYRKAKTPAVDLLKVARGKT